MSRHNHILLPFLVSKKEQQKKKKMQKLFTKPIGIEVGTVKLFLFIDVPIMQNIRPCVKLTLVE